jgi:C-lobe and N-lobe beta barrels of Tf-binding protein B
VVNGDYSISSSTDPAVTTAGSGSYNLFANTVGLQYTNFGTWVLSPCASNAGDCTPAYIGTFGGGQQGVSQTASMPTSGSATYSGGATGYVLQPSTINSNNAAQFYGSSSLTANFGTGAITGAITGIEAYGVSGSGSTQPALGTINDINLAGTISGSAYSGTAAASATAGTAFDISGATGTLKGAFYGPSADETAGVFNLSGGPNSTTLVGSFGAKQAAPSDRRLKVDVEPAGALPNGLMLYAWRYLGGSHRFTGVMAQDLLGDLRFADAVAIDGEGLMRVDYGRIGYLPSQLALMQEEGEAAVARYRQSLN